MSTRTAQAAATVRGATRQIRAAAGGLSGVFWTLAQEHRESSALLARLQASSDSDARRRLFPLIRKELLSHEKAESGVVYPVFADHDETAEIAFRHDRQAHTMEALIERLHATDVESDHWAYTLHELVQAVQCHVREEEHEFFPVGEQTLGRAKAIELELRYQATKHEIASRL